MLPPKFLFKATWLHSTLPMNVSVRGLWTGKHISTAPFAEVGSSTRRQVRNAQSWPLFTLSVLAWEEWQLANLSRQTAWLHQLHQPEKLLKANSKELCVLIWTQLVPSASTSTSQVVWTAIFWPTLFPKVSPYKVVSETNKSSALKNNFTKILPR